MDSLDSIDLVLTEQEIKFLKELKKRKIPFLVVGVSAAILQGAPLATQDLDIWFKKLSDPKIVKAVKKAGGAYVSTIIGMMNPPQFVGKGFEFLDIVTHPGGLDSFEKEYKHAIEIKTHGMALKVLPLDRIIKSKKEANRPKDKMALPALEATMATLRFLKKKKK